VAAPDALRDLALDIARAVAPEIGRQAGQVDVSVTKSTSTDLVTEVDTWSEAQIVSRILDARPDDSILGEEGAGVTGTSGVRWVVDPIDGTTDFVYGHPGFSVSIGVEVDENPVAGVIVDPLLGDEFCAAVGHGTTRNGEPVRVSDVDELPRTLMATGFSYDPDRRRRQARVLVEVLPRVRDIRRMGGAALDLASVSCGRVDAYFERGLNPWDCAAGAVLVTEAGGRVTDLDGRPTTGDMILAAPLAIHGPLLELLRSAGADRV
jgi:myo-inositol-1(or 4)-monophosphatase